MIDPTEPRERLVIPDEGYALAHNATPVDLDALARQACKPYDRRLECADCGTTFPYRYDWEVTLPPHNCAERQRDRRTTQED